MRPDDSPLPIPVADAPPTIDNIRDRLRAVYSQAISDIVDRCAEDLILPNDRAAIFLDVAQFTTFMMAVKIVEARSQQQTKENLMAAYWPMQKALKDEVPGMLREMAAAATGPTRGVA